MKTIKNWGNFNEDKKGNFERNLQKQSKKKQVKKRISDYEEYKKEQEKLQKKVVKKLKSIFPSFRLTEQSEEYREKYPFRVSEPECNQYQIDFDEWYTYIKDKNPEDGFFAGNEFDSEDELISVIKNLENIGATNFAVGGFRLLDNLDMDKDNIDVYADTLYFDIDPSDFKKSVKITKPKPHEYSQRVGTRVRFWWD